MNRQTIAVAVLAFAAGCSEKKDRPADRPAPVKAGDKAAADRPAGISEITPAALGLDADKLEGYFFVKKAGASRRVAIWAMASEGSEINAALFAGKPGAWEKKWEKKPLIEEGGMIEEATAIDLPVLEIGADRYAVLHAEEIEGCGDEDCKPEDDYTTSTLIELADGGPRVIWTTDRAPACSTEAVYTCTISTKPGADKSAHDLVVKIGDKTTTLAMSGGVYK